MPRVCSYPGARVRNSILHTYRIDAPAIAATAQSRAAADCFLVSGLAFPGSWRRRVAVCLLSAREVPITVNTRSCLLNFNSSTCSAGIRAPRRTSSDRKHYLPTIAHRRSACAFPAAHSHIPSAPLTCARAMCPQAGALVFVAAGGALARGAAARRARLRRDHFWAPCDLAACLLAKKL